MTSGAFRAAMADQAEALIVTPSRLTMLPTQRKRTVEFARDHGLPTMSSWRAFAQAGGLMIYGPDLAELYRSAAATQADKILRGAKPGDLPIEQPTKFELVMNLKTAKALGLTIPPSLLLRADQVID
jgi:putative ABC transport system substrate-binding protein